MRYQFEFFVTGFLALVAVVLSATHDLPFIAPHADGAAFVGIHYLAPTVAALAWALVMARRDPLASIMPIVVSIGSYGVVIWLHFNIKLWVPVIEPTTHDALFRASGEAIRPVVDAAFAARRVLAAVLPSIDDWYIHAYIAMFYFSFFVHAARSERHFRTVFRAALVLQALGAVAYLAMPAIGPFVYEAGMNALASNAQAAMMQLREQLVAAPDADIARIAEGGLFAGLAAMPSLHAGGAFLFLMFAAKWERWLLIGYIPVFVFILIEAVASRWHYVIDLPVGIALAAAAIAFTAWCESRETTASVAVEPELEPAP
ncbi:phosphatase PAP2 family protein [Pinisolibacter sp.]|uniref:phosphatase PAP2 family protein n=1 Tax=Pinisolibacter sp. TaxID=2172024 RepID=UPI002FDE1BF9